MTTLRLHCFETGRVRTKSRKRGLLRYAPGGWSDETLPVHAFAIEHPDGICVFDTGQTARARKSGYHQRWHPFLWTSRFELDPADELAAQMSRCGLSAELARWVVLSHLHTDHVGNVGAFPNAEVVVARREWEHAQGVAGRVRGYIPQRWPHEITPRLIQFEGPGIGPFPGSYDLAQDDSLFLVPLPGHTPGHMALLVRGNDERALLAGDAAHTPDELAGVAPDVVAWCEQEGIRVLLAHDSAARG